MLSPQMIALINHLAAVIGLAGSGAWTVRSSARHVCWMIVVLVVLFKAEKTSLAGVLKELPKP
jgi:hypothetical protein